MRLLGLMTILLSAAAWAAAAPATSQSAEDIASTQPTSAAVVVLNGVIDEYSRDLLIKRIDKAKADGAKTIILVLNTPGGLVHAAQDITRTLRAQTNTRVIAFVEEKAYSAGAMIAVACDEIVMSPHSFIGDCAPIMMTNDGGLATLGETERAKAESPVLADFDSSARRNNYDPLLMASMVSMKRVVHYVQDAAGEKRFVDDKEYDALTAKGWKTVEGVPDPLDRSDTLLTIDEKIAANIGLSKGTYASPQAFAQARGLDIRQTLAPSTGEEFIGWLGSPLLRGILIFVLLQAAYIAFSQPGHGWPEAIAAIALILLLGVPLLTGFASWWEVLAIILGLVLLAVEIFVLPGHLLPGILGILLLLGGLVMTFVGSEPSIPGVLPSLQGTWVALQRGLITVTAGLLCSLLLWVWLSKYLPKLPYFNKLILTDSAGGMIDFASPGSPQESGPAIGDIGVAVSELKPGGSVKFITESYPDGRIAAVVSDSGFVTPGTTVVVKEVAGNRVVVRPQA